MAATMYPDPTQHPSLMEAAKKGNPDAIARLLQPALVDAGLTVTTQVDQSQLNIVLTGQTAPESQVYPEWIISSIQHSIHHLQPQHIESIQIIWRDSNDPSAPQPGLSLSPSPIMAPIQIEPFSSDEIKEVAEQFTVVPSTHSSSQYHLSIGAYVSQWTPKGLLVTAPTQPSEAHWQKRSMVDPSHRCAPITRLLNRQTELKAAIATLQAGGTIEFSGEAGAGKTALLQAICHHPQLLPRFPSGIVYQQAYEQPLEDLMQTLFTAMYQERDQAVSLSQRADKTVDGHLPIFEHRKPTPIELKQHLSQHQLCLALDDRELSPESLQAWSQWPNLALVVANRRQISEGTHHRQTGTNTRHLLLKGLPIKDAVVLFEEGLERSLQPGEEKDAQILCAKLGGHPRRLVQMAALIRKHHVSLSELVKQLQQGTVAEAIILKSVSSLPESDRRVIAVLASLAGIPIHGTHLPTLTDLDNVTEQLKELVDQGLVWTDGHFYRLADNLHAPLHQHWNLSPWMDQALNYVKTWLRQFTPGNGYSQWGTPDYASATVTPVLHNSDLLWYLLSHAVRSQRWEDAIDLGTLITPGLWLGQRWGRWRQVLIAQWYAARSMQDKEAEATILHQLGSRALCLEDGLTAHACLAQAYAYRMELGDIVGATLSRHNLTILDASPFALHSSAPIQSKPLLKSQDLPSDVERPMAQFGENLPKLQTDTPLAQVMLNQISENPQEKIPPNASPPPKESVETPEPPSPTDPNSSATEASAAVLQTSPKWMSWLWLVVGTGSIALIGLIVLFLGKEPVSNISKLRPKHTFPPQRLGIPSDPHQFTITNTTASPMVIDVTFAEGDRQDFVINSDDCVRQSLPPEETCVIAAHFEPQTSGPRSASFMVQLGANNQPKPLTLQGVGAKVNAEYQPFELVFDDQIVAERSKAKTITFKNKGTVAFMVSGNRLTNNEVNAFFVEGDNCSGKVLQPRDNCTLNVSFLAPEVKNYRTILEIVDDTGTEIWRIPLMGAGIRPPRPAPSPQAQRPPIFPLPRPTPAPNNTEPESNSTPADPSASPQFTVLPTAIAFEQQELNTSSTQTIRIQNNGSRPLTVTKLTIAEPTHFTVIEETCMETSILPGNECKVKIAFTPMTDQPSSTTVSITSAQAGTQTIALQGTGIATSNAPEPSEALGPASPEINAFTTSPSNTVEPNDSVELCYDISGANTAYILNQTTGEEIAINPGSPDCIAQTILSTTSYTLVATNNNTFIESSTTIKVLDRDPPTTPVIIGPTGSHPIYCNSSVAIEWQSVTDEDNGPVKYSTTLQRQDVSISDTDEIETSATWTSLGQLTSDQPRLDISSKVQAPHVYRWQVQAIDTTGNASPPTAWNEFWCINP